MYVCFSGFVSARASAIFFAAAGFSVIINSVMIFGKKEADLKRFVFR